MIRSLTVVLLNLVSLGVAAPDTRYSRSIPVKNQFVPSRSYNGQIKARDVCPVPTQISTTAPKANPFVALSQDEIDAVGRWLLSPDQGLNLTDTNNPNVSLSDNYIWHIDILKPNKTDVLSYLDGDGTVPRHARVALIQGGLEVPVVAEYSVSLLNSMLAMSANFYLGRPFAHLKRNRNSVSGLAVQWCQWC